MKKAIYIFFLTLIASLFCINCGGSDRKNIKEPDSSDTEEADTVTDTDTDTDSAADTGSAPECGNSSLEEGEVCDNSATECSAVDPAYTGGYAICKSDCSGWDVSRCTENSDPADTSSVFNFGPYTVNPIDVKSGEGGAPRDFKIYEPAGAEGNIPVIHFLHGFTYKLYYYDNFLTQLASHGFVVVSSQSDHAMMGGDTTIVEAEKVANFLNWLKQNIQSKVSVTVDVEHFGVSGHSRGGKVTNRILNSDPAMATSFFGVDPVDSAPPVGGSSDPTSLSDPVQFTGESMFLGTELGPNGGMMACAPSGDNSVHFYASYPSPSRHIIAAGVGHADMVDPEDISSCGVNCTICAGSSDDGMKSMFVSYTGGLMAAFFNATLKGQTQYEALLDDVSQHPFLTTLAEHK